jgi:hypothetical protein
MTTGGAWVEVAYVTGLSAQKLYANHANYNAHLARRRQLVEQASQPDLGGGVEDAIAGNGATVPT